MKTLSIRAVLIVAALMAVTVWFANLKTEAELAVIGVANLTDELNDFREIIREQIGFTGK